MIFHDIPQNSPEWDLLRLGKATASKFACFMANDGKAFGEPARRYALQLALERLTGRKSEYSFKNDDMDRGHEQEPEARMLYEESRFVDVTNGGFFDHGEWGDSPDGLIGDDGVYEGKAVIAPTHYANLRRGTFDPAYRWQLVGHLDGTGRQWVDFASYCAEFPESLQLIVYRLTRDECAEEIERLRTRRDEFLSLVHSTFAELQQQENAA
jgi:hypothetical protein